MPSAVPNLLTIFRFFLVYPIVLCILESQFIWAIILYILAALTDFLDGLIARKFNLISNFGRIADPIADKTLIIGALLALSLIGEINLTMTYIILGRDIFVISGFILSTLLLESFVVEPHFSGKANAFFLMVYLGLILINAAGLSIPLELINTVAVFLIITIIWSTYAYLKNPGKKVLKEIFS